LIQQKVIGDIKLFNAVYMADIAGVANPVSSSAILNLGCYPISLIRLLAGSEPVDIVSLGRIDKLQKDNQASIILKFEHDVMAMVTTADDMAMYAQFDVFGTEGHLRMLTNPWFPDQQNNKIQIYRNDTPGLTEINVTADKSLYTYEIDMVNQLIYSDGELSQTAAVSWADSMGNIALLDAWIRQVNTFMITGIAI